MLQKGASSRRVPGGQSLRTHITISHSAIISQFKPTTITDRDHSFPCSRRRPESCLGSGNVRQSYLSMALLQNRDACKSWTSLLITVSQMVDWVHFTTTHDTFHQVVSPRIWEAVNKLSGIYADEDATVDLATELKQLLMQHSWDGRAFAEDVSAVDLLSALKGFRLKCERPLGKGAYAKVFLARSQLTDEVVVHKHVQIDSPEHGLPLHVLRELSILQKMRHPHIVRCRNCTSLLDGQFGALMGSGSPRGLHPASIVLILHTLEILARADVSCKHRKSAEIVMGSAGNRCGSWLVIHVALV